MSLGGDAEAKKSKKANFFTTFEILKFAQSDKVSTIPIQQFTLIADTTRHVTSLYFTIVKCRE